MAGIAQAGIIDTYYEDFDDKEDDATIDGVDGTWSVEEGDAFYFDEDTVALGIGATDVDTTGLKMVKTSYYNDITGIDLDINGTSDDKDNQTYGLNIDVLSDATGKYLDDVDTYGLNVVSRNSYGHSANYEYENLVYGGLFKGRGGTPAYGLVGIGDDGGAFNTSIYTYGVVGLANDGITGNIGVYGATGTETIPTTTSGNYAGYFAGDVLVSGTAFLGLIDLGTNTIDDTSMTGDWDFNGGDLTGIDDIELSDAVSSWRSDGDLTVAGGVNSGYKPSLHTGCARIAC